MYLVDLNDLKASLATLDAARDEHMKRVDAALARMETGATLGEANNFVGTGASRAAYEAAVSAVERAARVVCGLPAGPVDERGR